MIFIIFITTYYYVSSWVVSDTLDENRFVISRTEISSRRHLAKCARIPEFQLVDTATPIRYLVRRNTDKRRISLVLVTSNTSLSWRSQYHMHHSHHPLLAEAPTWPFSVLRPALVLSQTREPFKLRHLPDEHNTPTGIPSSLTCGAVHLQAFGREPPLPDTMTSSLHQVTLLP